MRRSLLFVLLILLASSARAQLTTGGGAGATALELQPSPSFDLPSTRGPAPILAGESEPRIRPFDFAQTKPHLAFFCRLELNIEEATRFPVRFRLGEVRTWQQELTKRD